MKQSSISLRICLIVILTMVFRQEIMCQDGGLPFPHDHSTNGTGVCWGYAMGRAAGYSEGNGVCNPNTAVPPNTKDDPSLWPGWSIHSSYWDYTYDPTLAGIGPGDIVLFGQHAAYVESGHSGDQTISIREIPAAGGVPQSNTLTKTSIGQTFYYNHPSQRSSLGWYKLKVYPVNARNEFLYHNVITTNQGSITIGGTSGTSPFERNEPWTGSSVYATARQTYPSGNYQVYSKWRKFDGSTISINPLAIVVNTSGNNYYAEFDREISVSMPSAQGVESGGTFSYAINNTNQGSTWQGMFYENRDFGMPGPITIQASASGDWRFLNWNDGVQDNPRTFYPTDNVSIFATFKAHLKTGNSPLADTKNQRRVISYGTSWAMVYESMGDIWVTYSADAGSTWSNEQKINSIAGQACNPTISNLYSNNRAVMTWIENNGGIAELHLQTFILSAGETGQAIWWGWNPSSGQRGPQNHTTINSLLRDQIPGSYFTWRARLDARPVLFLSSDGSSLLVGSERSGSGIMAAKVIGPGNFTTAYTQRDGLNDGVAVSTNTADKQPVIISYPSVYGFPASTRFFYLAWGYGAGHRIAQFDYIGRTTSLVTGEYGEYTYYSLQGSVSPANGSFVLAAEDLNGSSGQHDVCVFFKPTYYGSSLPSLGNSYTSFVQPALMAEPGGFGSPPSEVNAKSSSTSTWYKLMSGTSTTLGTSISGMFLREQIASGDHASEAVRGGSGPYPIQHYSGTGTLSKSSGDDLATNLRAFRFWKDENEQDRMAVLDFSGSSIEVIDSLQNADNFCIVKIVGPPFNTVFVRQVDSLETTMTVEILRDGRCQQAFTASAWTTLTTVDLRDANIGDMIRFRPTGKISQFRAYQEISLAKSPLNKQIPQQEPFMIEQHLRPLEQAIGVYPNPFNPTTTFSISLPTAQRVQLAVYNLAGQFVADVVNGDLGAGRHTYSFNGSQLASGVYFYRCLIGEKIKSGRLLLLK